MASRGGRNSHQNDSFNNGGDPPTTINALPVLTNQYGGIKAGALGILNEEKQVKRGAGPTNHFPIGKDRPFTGIGDFVKKDIDEEL